MPEEGGAWPVLVHVLQLLKHCGRSYLGFLAVEDSCVPGADRIAEDDPSRGKHVLQILMSIHQYKELELQALEGAPNGKAPKSASTLTMPSMPSVLP